MRLSRYLTLLAIVTLAAVFYVSQQVETVKLGYQISAQQLALSDTLDQRQMLLYNVCNLKSPKKLQESFYKSSEKPQDFQILRNKQIILLANTKRTPGFIEAAKKSLSGFVNFFALTSLAQAEIQE